jgi:hypothetical protein
MARMFRYPSRQALTNFVMAVCPSVSQWMNFREIFHWGLYGILLRNSIFAESRKKMSATLHEDKCIRLVCSNVGIATKRRMHCCATVGMTIAFITLLTTKCLRGVPMTTVVTPTPHNVTFTYVACLILFNFVVMFVLNCVHLKEFQFPTAETK